MATLLDLRTQVRRDLHDLAKPQEQTIDADPSKVVYPVPTLGPISNMTLDIDGVVQASGSYTLWESGFVQFPTPPTGAQLHAIYQFSRYSDADLNQWIQEAIREFSMVHPKLNTRRRTPTINLQTAQLIGQYNPGDGVLLVNSTAGYDPRGVVILGGIAPGTLNPSGQLGPGAVMYFYTGITSGSFTGVTVWVGPDKVQALGTVCIQDDNTVHGWFFDPSVVRDVYRFHGYETPDAFGLGTGYQEIAYWNYDPTTGYFSVEFDFSQLEVGNAASVAPVDQFQVTTGEYWSNPVNDTDVLDVPDYALNPISWLAAALAAESREGDRDAGWREASGADTTADPTLTYVKAGEANRKKWNEWVKKQFRSTQYPISRRRIYQL